MILVEFKICHEKERTTHSYATFHQASLATCMCVCGISTWVSLDVPKNVRNQDLFVRHNIFAWFLFRLAKSRSLVQSCGWLHVRKQLLLLPRVASRGWVISLSAPPEVSVVVCTSSLKRAREHSRDRDWEHPRWINIESCRRRISKLSKRKTNIHRQSSLINHSAGFLVLEWLMGVVIR